MSNNINRIRFIMLFLSFNVLAGNVDLQIKVDITKTDNLSFGEVVPFSLTIKNLGPDDANGDQGLTYPNGLFIKNIFFDVSTHKRDMVFEFNDSYGEDCLEIPITQEPPINPSVPIMYDYFIGVVKIPAYSSITCKGNIIIYLKSGSRTLDFKVKVYQPDVEGDNNNNLQSFLFSLKPKVIPASNLISLLILFVSVLLVVLFRTRKLMVD